MGVGACYAGPLGLVLQSIIAQTVGITSLGRDMLRANGGKIPRSTIPRLREVAKTYRQYPIFSTGAGLLNSFGLLAPLIILNSLYGSDIGGQYSLAWRIMTMPMALIGSALGQVFLAEAAHRLHDDPAGIPPLFDRVTAQMARLSLIVLALGAASPWIFGLIFGHNWTTAGWYAFAISIYCAIQLVVSPISNITALVNRQDVQLVLDLLRAVMVVAVLYIPHYLGYSAMVSVICYSIGMTLVYILYYIMFKWLANGLRKQTSIV
jgi:O-antigen/teichoic acid export membrane protein